MFVLSKTMQINSDEARYCFLDKFRAVSSVGRAVDS